MPFPVRIIELFAGIGAFRRALQQLNDRVEVLFISEKDRKVETAYRKIFSDKKVKNLGDIKKAQNWNLSPYKGKCDFLFLGSPCQDFSIAGLNRGGGRSSGTRSSLIWHSLHVIKEVKPKVIVFENVKNLFCRHKQLLDEFIEELKKQNYDVTLPVILNALNFNIPQNRERIFLVALFIDFFKEEKRRELIDNHHSLKEIKSIPDRESIKDFLKMNFHHRKFTKDQIQFRKWTNFCTWKAKSGNINGSYNRAWKITRYCGALNASNPVKITDGEKVSCLDVREYALLMGFTREDCNKVEKVLTSKNKIRSIFGNSIVVPVAKKVIEKLNLELKN